MRKKPESKFIKYDTTNNSSSSEFSLDDLSILDKKYTDSKGDRLFLKRFSKDDIYSLLEHSGIIKHLKSIGFDKLLIDIDFDDSQVSTLKLFKETKKDDNLLIDLKLSEARFVPDKKLLHEKTGPIIYDMVIIEWLSAQNSDYKNDKLKRPLLPGQMKPGLGALNYFFIMMNEVSKKIFNDGFLVVPDHFHGSIMYGKRFKFFNPENEAVLRAILLDLKKYSLPDISWGMITETIINKKSNKPEIFKPEEQILPVSKKIKEYFDSKYYKSAYNEILKKKSFYLDYDMMIKKKEDLLKKNRLVDL